MFIFDLFRTVRIVTKAEKYVKKHTDVVTVLLSKLQAGLSFYEKIVADLAAKEAKIKAAMENLRKVLGK